MKNIGLNDIETVVNNGKKSIESMPYTKHLEKWLDQQTFNESTRITDEQCFELIQILINIDRNYGFRQKFYYPLIEALDVNFFRACFFLEGMELLTLKTASKIALMKSDAVQDIANSFYILTLKKWDDSFTQMFWDFPYEFSEIIAQISNSQLTKDHFQNYYQKFQQSAPSLNFIS